MFQAALLMSRLLYEYSLIRLRASHKGIHSYILQPADLQTAAPCASACGNLRAGPIHRVLRAPPLLWLVHRKVTSSRLARYASLR